MPTRRRDLEALAAKLKVLADPNRLCILDALLDGERCNCELGGALGLPANLVSHHLRVLERAGFVLARRDPADARWIHYRAISGALDQFAAAVQSQLGLRRRRMPSRRPGQVCRPATTRAA
jgi:ArsR family transcriptional regulator